MDIEAFAVWLMIMAIAFVCYACVAGYIHIYIVEKGRTNPLLPAPVAAVAAVISLMLGVAMTIGAFSAYADVKHDNEVYDGYYQKR